MQYRVQINLIWAISVKDWLYGIISNHPGGNKDTVVDGAFEAEDVLSMCMFLMGVEWRSFTILMLYRSLSELAQRAWWCRCHSRIWKVGERYSNISSTQCLGQSGSIVSFEQEILPTSRRLRPYPEFMGCQSGLLLRLSPDILHLLKLPLRSRYIGVDISA